MNKIESFRDIIKLWPTRAFFAAELGIKPGAAQQMDLRDSIHHQHFERLVTAAAKIGRADIDFPLLTKLLEKEQRKRKQRRRAA